MFSKEQLKVIKSAMNAYVVYGDWKPEDCDNMKAIYDIINKETSYESNIYQTSTA